MPITEDPDDIRIMNSLQESIIEEFFGEEGLVKYRTQGYWNWEFDDDFLETYDHEVPVIDEKGRLQFLHRKGVKDVNDLSMIELRSAWLKFLAMKHFEERGITVRQLRGSLRKRKIEYPRPDEDTVNVWKGGGYRPLFRGGNINDFRMWFQENIEYPEAAYNKLIQGRVVVAFVVEKDGRIYATRIVKNPDLILTGEVLRVMRSAPPWTPASRKGKPCSVLFTMPIDFRLW